MQDNLKIPGKSPAKRSKITSLSKLRAKVNNNPQNSQMYGGSKHGSKFGKNFQKNSDKNLKLVIDKNAGSHHTSSQQSFVNSPSSNSQNSSHTLNLGPLSGHSSSKNASLLAKLNHQSASSLNQQDSMISTIPQIIYAYERQCEYTAIKLNSIREGKLPEIQKLNKELDVQMKSDIVRAESDHTYWGFVGDTNFEVLT